jgi:hypothetical protein
VLHCFHLLPLPEEKLPKQQSIRLQRSRPRRRR